MSRTRPTDSEAAPPGRAPDRLGQSPEFQLLAGALADVVLVLDGDGRVAYVGAGAGDVFGSPAGDLVGRPFRDLLSDRGSLPPRVAGPGTWEARLCSGAWVSVTACEMTGGAAGGDGAGGFDGHLLLLVRPVGDERVARDRLDLFRRALDATNGLVVVADATQPDLPISFVSQHFLEVTGYERGEVLGRNCRFLQTRPDGTRDDDQEGVRTLGRALGAGEAVHALVRNYTKDGRLFWNDVFVTPIHDGAGRLTHFVGVQNDVTERVEAEAALGAQDRLLRAFCAAAPVPLGVLYVEPDGAPVYREANAALAALYGSTPEGVVGRPVAELDGGPFDADAWRREARACLEGAAARTLESPGSPGAGARHLRATLTPLGARTVAVAVEDTTEFDRLAAAQAERTAALEHAADAVVITDATLQAPGPVIHYVNRAFEEMTGYDRGEVVGRDPRFMQSGQTDRAELRRMRRQMEAGRPFRGELVNERKDGAAYIVQIDVAPLRDDAGAVVGFVSTQRDVTDRRRLEGEVLSAAARAQEDVARDLHDSVGQVLAGTAYYLHGLAESLSAEGSAHVDEARRAADLVQDAQRQARALAHGLSPVALGTGGLAAALRRLAEETAETYGVTCRFLSAAPPPVGPPDRAADLYRIAQEAVANAVRHGRPESVTVRLEPPHTTDGAGTRGDGLALLAVEDDGGGIGDDALDDGGLGLRTMRYRARRVGGTLDVSRREGGGTAVLVRFPVEGAALSDRPRAS